MTIEVDRRQVMAYRVAEQGLDRRVASPADLAVLDLGVQDTPYGSARLALAARATTVPGDGELASAWSVRGAPHYHRWEDLRRFAEALWPFDDADATARIAGPQISEGAKLGLEAFRVTADAFREVVTEPLPKGAVSTAVSARVPESLTYDCRSCKARHIFGGLFQQAGLAGGARLEPAAKTTLAPVAGWPGVPARASGTGSLVTAYLRLLGPATATQAAKFLGTSRSKLQEVWPPDLVELRVEGSRAWLPGDRVGALTGAPTPGPEAVRLLPPSDPFLQARDRELLVPDPNRRKEIWRILGNPGVVLAGGEIVGTWRSRMAGKSKLAVTVTPFGKVPTRTRSAIEDEAATVAAARGAKDVTVEVEG